MDISTNIIEHFGIVAGIFDELGICEIIDSALPKTRHHKASHSAIVNAMVLNVLVLKNHVSISTPIFSLGSVTNFL